MMRQIYVATGRTSRAVLHLRSFDGVEVTQKNRNVLTDIPIFYLLSFIIK